jgi:hypothetical protein
MTGVYHLALTGDVIMNTRVSACRDPDVLAAVDLLRTADVTHAHLEIPLHDFDRDDIFGAAEGAMAWYRGPTAIAKELRWLGVDLVSTASNHALDYSYGGLGSTCAALDAAGLAHAGSGADLAAARQGWVPTGGRALADGVPRLRERVAEAGRDPCDLEVIPFLTAAQAAHRRIDALERAGATEIAFDIQPGDGRTVRGELDRLAELIGQPPGT